MRAHRLPQTGEPAPWFVAPSAANPTFHFDTVAGRYIVLCFFGSAADSGARAVLDWMESERTRFDDVNIAFFGVSMDAADEHSPRTRERVPGIRFFWDFDRTISRTYGLISDDPKNVTLARTTFVLDPMLRILAVIPFALGIERHNVALSGLLRNLPPMPPSMPAAAQAPVLIVPRIFEPALCRHLIETFEADGGKDSGFMRDIDGRTVGLVDYTHKRRHDCIIEDERLKCACMTRIHDRLVPQIARAFQFRATRMERYIVACYDAAWGGHFRPHRDDTTLGTAHRRFAVTINLNTDEYVGGQLRFPEFGQQLFEAPVGGAVVFSCSLLHEAMPVLRGKRYAFLPFLHDEAAAEVRHQNQRFLGESNRD